MVQNSQTVGHHFKFLSLRKPFMLGKNGIKIFDHIFPEKLTLTLLGDHSLTPSILKRLSQLCTELCKRKPSH
jgi:hypothetical protein